MKNEKDVKKAVKKLLDKHGWFYWMPPANGFGRIGVADFNALRGGVFLAIETKFGTNQPTVHQRAYLSSIMAEDGFGFVVNEKRLDCLAKWMDAFDKSAKDVSVGKQPTPEDGAAMLDAIREMTHELS